jgi:hypothetical protein
MTNGQPNQVLQGGVSANATANGRNLVSQLFGLNEEAGANGSFGGGAGQIPASAPTKRPTFNGSYRKLKLSDAFTGINITHNFLFLVLFLGFTFWLFVVYWVRHHEPLANDVLGVGSAYSKTADADRRLMAQIKRTLPVHTSSETGNFYVPIPQGNGQFAASGDFAASNGAAYGAPQSAMPLPPPPLPAPPSPTPPSPTPLSYYAPYGNMTAPSAQPQAYLTPVRDASCTRVKMIVTR